MYISLYYFLKGAVLMYCRLYQWDEKANTIKERNYASTGKSVCAVGVNFEFELYDNFLGQFATTFFPHNTEDAFLSPINDGPFHGIEWSNLQYTKQFVGEPASKKHC